MTTVHKAKDSVIKRLHAHTDAVDAQIQKTFHISLAFLRYILRIDLYGKFIERPSVPCFLQSPHQTTEYRKGQHRWGAAAYIQSIDFIRHFLSTHPCLSCQRFGKLPEKLSLPYGVFSIAALRCDLRIEVAICAETPAERDVDIYHGYRNISSADPRRVCSVYASTV